ncbi:hypothetical protein RJ641_025613, partial [Dillenia turbinata]
CRYGGLALGFNGGHVAAGVPSLYKGGAGCDAKTQLCSTASTRVIITDLNQNNKTDFLISSRAFAAMACQGMGQEILKFGIVDVDYKRLWGAQTSSLQNFEIAGDRERMPSFLSMHLELSELVQDLWVRGLWRVERSFTLVYPLYNCEVLIIRKLQKDVISIGAVVGFLLYGGRQVLLHCDIAWGLMPSQPPSNPLFGELDANENPYGPPPVA